MASFIVRMVLKSGEWSDYEKLYTRMEMRGFEKEITGDNGQTYELPDAEYIFNGSGSKEGVFDKAKSAAEGLNLKYSILVTESKGMKWVGLDRV